MVMHNNMLSISPIDANQYGRVPIARMTKLVHTLSPPRCRDAEEKRNERVEAQLDGIFLDAVYQ
jgi:hypothetical protein